MSLFGEDRDQNSEERCSWDLPSRILERRELCGERASEDHIGVIWGLWLNATKARVL